MSDRISFIARLAKGPFPIVLSIGSRAILFLTISWYIYSFAQATEAVQFFQAIFLQSVLISFLSASSFFYLVNPKWDGKDNGLVILVHICLALASVPIVIALIWTSFLNISSSLITCLTIGAFCVGISSPIRGILVKRRGALTAYLPSVIIAPVATLVPILGGGEDVILSAIIAIVGYQLFVLLFELCILANKDRDVLFSLLACQFGSFSRVFGVTLIYGLCNTSLVAYTFWFREQWAATQDPAFASTVFFLFRIFDTLLGIIVLDIATRIDALDLIRRKRTAIVSLLLAGGVISITGLHYIEAVVIDLFHRAILMQVVLETIRVPAVIFFLYHSVRRSGVGYIAYNIGTVTASFLILTQVSMSEMPSGIFIFVLVLSIISGGITCLFDKLSEKRR